MQQRRGTTTLVVNYMETAILKIIELKNEKYGNQTWDIDNKAQISIWNLVCKQQ